MCDETIKLKSKSSHFKSNTHKEFDKCKHLELSIENPNISDVDEIFYPYIIEHNKKYDYNQFKCHFKLAFSDNQRSEYVKPPLFDSKTITSLRNFLENVIRYFKDKGYDFNPIAETNTITIANKMFMSYDFYIKHNMHAVEWKLNAIVTKSKNLINELDRSKRHPLIRKFSHVPFNKCM